MTQIIVSGLFNVLNELNVKNIIISKQFKSSTNYKEFLEIVSAKKSNVIIVEAGSRINIEKNIYIDILWPDSNKVINDNVLNNNSIVCKMVYNNFSILFTGDIEEIAEKAILEKYKNNLNILNADVLKVAHHGSKSSSIQPFLNVVKPKYALIGVSKTNNFGHPSNIVLESLKSINCKIYRTDINGEIVIYITRKKFQIKTRFE